MKPWVAVMISLATLISCGSVTPEHRIAYTVGECDQNIPMEQLADWAGVDIAVQDGVVQVHQKLAYVCCAEIQIRLERDGNVIKLIETNVGETCLCMCGYEVEMAVSNLPPGRYAIQVWGVEEHQAQPLELLGEAQVEL